MPRMGYHTIRVEHPHEWAELKRDAEHYGLPVSQFLALLWRNWKAQGKPPLVCLAPGAVQPWTPSKRFETH
jgi:hypothetical protein